MLRIDRLFILLAALAIWAGCTEPDVRNSTQIVSGTGDNTFTADVGVPRGEAASLGTYSGTVTYPDGREFEISGNRRGTIAERWLTDLGGNGYPELIIWMVEAGSGSYAAIHIYWMTDDGPKFQDASDLPDVVAAGYMGHDSLSIDDHRLQRCFPTYETFDTNFSPTGEKRCLVYNSMAGWVAE